MNKVKLFFRVEIGDSQKSADISIIRDKKKFFEMCLRPTNFKKFQVNTISLSNVTRGVMIPMGQIGLMLLLHD